MTARSQPYRIEWPLTPEQLANIDEMFQILFDDIRNGTLTLTASQITDLVSVVTSIVNANATNVGGLVGSLPGSSTSDGEDGERGDPGPQGLQGLQGPQGYTIRGEDGEDTTADFWPPITTGLRSDAITMPSRGLVTGGVSLTRDVSTRGSSGVIDGTLTYVTQSGPTAVDVLAGEGFLRSTDDQQAPLEFITWPAMTGISIPAPAAGQETTRFIGIQYNSGSPQVVVKTSFTWNWYDEFPLARVSLEDDGDLTILNAYAHAEDTANNARKFLRLVFPFQREFPPEGSGGLELGETGTRNLTMTAGNVWHGFNRYAILAVDTSILGQTCELHYRRLGGGFVNVMGVTQWPNTQYDDGSGTLATMSNNKYAVLWFYVDVAEATGVSLHGMYGRNEYNTVADAEAEAAPTIPDHLTYHGRLIGRLIFQKSAATATKIESAWAQTFTASAVSNHNQLSGLQGGTTGEYYHLTAADYARTVAGLGGIVGSIPGVNTVDGEDGETWPMMPPPAATGLSIAQVSARVLLTA